ncbi:MAG: UMP kinase [Lentisphaeria bacterium]|nr:UMP kinase [Lentisphaeria bacterium]
MAELLYKRIILKLSGEALKGKEPGGLNPEALEQVGRLVKSAYDLGAEIALVCGGGNFFRGLPASQEICVSRCTADAIGMMATVMNGLALRDAVESAGIPARIQSAFVIPGVANTFDHLHAEHLMSEGNVMVFAGGTGLPFFTTDTTAALRACQVGAHAVVKATKVDGVYTADPNKNPQAKRYRSISYHDAINQRLGIMDSTSFSLCMDNNVPIIVYNFAEEDGLASVLLGNTEHATVVGNVPTALA